MAFVNPKLIINNNVESLKDRVNSPYTKFIDKTPVFVTYYNQSRELSTTDVHLGNVEEIIGSESPIRYNKVSDFVMYGIETLNISIQNNEYTGLEADSIVYESIILPNTITPVANDFVTIQYLDKSYFFRVTSATFDSLNSNNFYKVELEFSKIITDIATFESQQVDGTYVLHYENIGTQYKTIIASDKSELLRQFQLVYSNISNYYMELFYSGRVNSFIYSLEPGRLLYDKFLTKFIISNNLFENVYLSVEIAGGNDFSRLYNETLYKSVELQDLDGLSDRTKIMTQLIENQLSIFSQYRDFYFDLIFMDDTIANPLMLDYFTLGLYDAIKANTASDNIMTKVIVDYFNNKFITPEDVEVLSGYWFEHNLSTYATLPLLLFVIRHNINKLRLAEQSTKLT